MTENDKPLVWMNTEVKSPPFSKEARLEAGFLLRKLQKGQELEMPYSMPMQHGEFSIAWIPTQL